MIDNREFVIAIQGKSAVNAGCALQGDQCYKSITDWNGRFMGQLEVVLDNPEVIYKGIPSQWVDVSFITMDDIERVLKYLAKVGFAGCPCMIMQENRNWERINGKPNDGILCCMII